jgi:FMN phosphatase YigB (HAD superfamily)
MCYSQAKIGTTALAVGFTVNANTDFETMHASKPHAAYYNEIAKMIGVDPQDCLMVGNEVKNDILPARKARMKTFWVTNAGSIPTDVPADWVGTLEEFATLIEKAI